MSPRLAHRVLARKIELEDALADCPHYDESVRQAIVTALAHINQLVTGDVAHPSSVVSRAMARWLERHRHLATG